MSDLVPFPFQIQSVYDTEQKFGGRVLLGNDMGLGKSLCALWTIKRQRIGQTYPVLVVCPKILRQQWINFIHQILEVDPVILQSRTPWNTKFEGKVAIINSEVLSFWRHWLENQHFQTMVLDECHHYTHVTAKRTETATLLIKQTPFALALSGTPLENRPIELFEIIHALNPRAWPDRDKFGHKYCGARYGRRGWTYDGSSNEDELRQKLRDTVLVRYLKSDVLDQLPAKVRNIIPVELRHREEYDKAQQDFLGWITETYPDRLKKAVRNAALMRSGHLLRLAARLKLKSVIEWINYRLTQTPDEKIVVYGIHRKCIDALKRRLNARSVVINGAVTGKQRRDALHLFEKDKNTRLLIANIAAAGLGLNLVHATVVCVVELMWKPGPLLQVEDRVCRIGQDQRTWIYYFIGNNTIEEKVSRLLQRKSKIITSVLDEGGERDDFDLYDLILEDMANENTMLRRQGLAGLGHNTKGVPIISGGNGHHRR